MKKLYEQDHKTLYSDILKEADTPVITKPKPTVEVGKELPPEQQAEINKMYENIARTSQNPMPGKKTTIKFTVGKGKLVFNTTGTPLDPRRDTMIGKGTFAERYKKQLDSFFFTDGDINPDNLIPFIMLMKASEGGAKSVKLVSNKNKAILIQMAQTLNKFFEENQSIISGMFTMFNGAMAMQQQGLPDV